ncbi:MAG: polyphosphate kinase, partial [Candidatus Binataceae bacterium]|nr:polyphosphate kinase [Candidatus Binataceae bacterium]
PGLNVVPIVEEAAAPPNGAANLDPHNSAVVVDGAVAVAAAEVEKAPPPRIDKELSSPDLFLNRELTWLAFNRRVLHEAEDERNPLLERLKFLAITASNLDEFFMKRIGGLKQQVVAGMQELTVDGRTPQQQIAECYAVVREQEQRQRELGPQILAQLEQYGIRLRPYSSLTADERKTIREYYYKNIFPLVTPQAMDPAHPFPFVSNLSLNLLVTARYQNDSDPMMARVKVPIGFGIPRFLRIANQNDFVRLEDVVANNLDLLFPSMIIDSYELFRVTRNANTERDEDEADDLLALIESELRDRRFAPIVRLEVLAGMNPVHRGMVAAELGLDERSDVFEVDGMLSMRDLQELAAIDAPALHDPPHHPVDHPRLTVGRSIFHVIRDAGSILLLHPYESFSTSVERFLREAADDPKVRAIKMTLYRTSSDSKIIGYLCDAARNGKQVAVVVELKARFDEAANIQFATRLEEFGIHVTYGVVGLKTHCKVILVIRQDYNGLRRYAHIGTGNYHPGTARFYADYGLLTCDDTIGEDLTQLFNYLTTGYMPDRSYRKILPAPTHLKRGLLNRIEREIKVSSAASPGLIQFKVNALEDVDITRALYRASQAGVKVDLIVRDTCRLRPGIAGLSENVRVVSIVGRFLEHGRLYYFRNGGAEDFLLGSADCMKRNLESRVEVVAPVEDPLLRKELRAVIDIQLKPNRCQWEMQSDGVYIRTPAADAAPACQQALIDFADTRQTEASKVKRRRSKGFARRAAREERNGD